ncbi:lytic murein transglycosylase [Hyphomicrobiales bacterium 4NK60-0047b]
MKQAEVGKQCKKSNCTNFISLIIFGLISVSIASKELHANEKLHTNKEQAISDPKLALWKNELWKKAEQLQIKRSTFDRAIKTLEPNYKLPRVRTHKAWAQIKRAQEKSKKTGAKKPVTKNGLPLSCYRPRQSEFLFPTKYFPKKHMNSLVSRGKKLKKKYGKTFKKIEDKYGVDIRAVLGIWGRETAFGAAKNRFDGVKTLLSLAYASAPEKREQHTTNLLSALKFIDDGHISIKNFKTSFAGATGYPQFTPDVFEQYAVDWDGDGRKNIWSNVPDAVASAANYLKGIGWQRNQTWGYEVEVPDNFDCWQEGPKSRMPVASWLKQGVRRVDGHQGRAQKFPDQNLLAQFMAPAGMRGPKFLVFENFEVFRRYNKADLYALFVGQLGNKIYCRGNAENCEFRTKWPQKDTFNFSRKRICEMQSHLKSSKASDETPDGLFGGKTRRGIGTFEMQNNLQKTCFPTQKLLKILRNK